MNHSRAQELLSAYLERDLGDAECTSVEAHVAGCDACGADLDALRSTVALLRRLPEPEPPPYLASRVMARIAEGEGRPAGWRLWLARLAAPAIAAPVAAAVAALLVLELAQPQPSIEVVAPSAPGAVRGLAIVQRPVGPVAPADFVAHGALPSRLLARALRGAGHPHSTSLATHFEGPTEAVVASWSSR